MTKTVSEIAQWVQGEVIGDGSLPLTGFAPAAAARAGDLTFAENEVYFQQAQESAASAILVDHQFKVSQKTLICVAKPRVAFARLLPLFFPEESFAAGVHPTAVISPKAVVDPSAHIGPHCILADGVKIGPGVVLMGNNYVGPQSEVGEGTRLFPQVTLYSQTKIGKRVRIHSGAVIGSDGFGYVLDGAVHRKVPQIGNVIIGDDVEIGSNVSIDRGALGPTSIGKGTKIDNLVQIAHNVSIGEHCLIISQVGIAGSTTLGNYVTLAGQVGLNGHIKIGDRAIIAAQSGVKDDVPEGGKYFGSPAQPDKQTKRVLIAMQQLPELIRRVRALEKVIQGTEESGIAKGPE